MRETAGNAAESIFHITTAAQWEQARQEGTYRGSTRGHDLDEVGFVHCSFSHQLAGVAEAIYGDAPADLVLLTIDPGLVDAPIRVENLDGGDEGYPHVYGPIPVAAVTGCRPVPVDDSDRLVLPA